MRIYFKLSVKIVNEISDMSSIEIQHRVNSKSSDQSQASLPRKNKYTTQKQLHINLGTYLKNMVHLMGWVGIARPEGNK